MSVRIKKIAKSAPLERSVPIFAALGEETRLKLIVVLCVGGAMSITQLTAGTDLSRQAVTKHLGILAEAGLVKDAKVGRERLWEFEPNRLDDARRSLELIASQWEDALQRLRLAVETG